MMSDERTEHALENEKIVIIKGDILSTNWLEGTAEFKNDPHFFASNEQNINCRIRLNNAEIIPQYDWSTTNSEENIEFFVIPQYNPKHFEAKVIEIEETVQWANMTIPQAVVFMQKAMKNNFPLLDSLGLRNIFGSTPGVSPSTVRPFLNLPSGMALYAHPSKFFELFSLTPHVEPLLVFGDNSRHSTLASDRNYTGMYNFKSEAVRYESIEEYDPTTLIKNIIWDEDNADDDSDNAEDEDSNDALAIDDGGDDDDDADDEETEENAEIEENGGKRISSEGQLHKHGSAKRSRKPFTGFGQPVKIYVYFDNTETSSMINHELQGRDRPVRSIKIPININDKTKEIVRNFNNKLSETKMAENIFDKSLTTVEEEQIFSVTNTVNDTSKWNLTIKPKRFSAALKRDPDCINFEVYINKTFSIFLGYSVPLETSKLINLKEPFYRFRRLGFTNSITFASADEIDKLLKPKFPLFICLKEGTRDIGVCQTMTIGKEQKVVIGIINSIVDNDVTLLPGYTSRIDRLVNHKIILDIVDRDGNCIQHHLYVYLVCILTLYRQKQ